MAKQDQTVLRSTSGIRKAIRDTSSALELIKVWQQKQVQVRYIVTVT